MTEHSPEVVTYRPDMVDMLPLPDNPAKQEAVITLAAVQRHLQDCKNGFEEPLPIQHVLRKLAGTVRQGVRECMFPPPEFADILPVLGVRAEKAQMLAKLLMHTTRPHGIGQKGAENFERYVERLTTPQTT
jgi:hypothetical protein